MSAAHWVEEGETMMRSIPMRVHEMPNDVLLLLAASGDDDAARERFLREVMHVDGLAWPEADRRVDELADEVSKSHVTQFGRYAIGGGAVAFDRGDNSCGSPPAAIAISSTRSDSTS